MKHLLPLFALVLGCGSAQQPAPVTTATSQQSTTIPAPQTTVATPTPAPTSTSPAPTPANTATEVAPTPPPAPATDAPPTLKGTLDGKPFVARFAIATNKADDGRVLVQITDYENACVRMEDAREGEQTFSMFIEWKAGEVAFTRSTAGGQDPFYFVMGKRGKAKRTDFKLTGKVELASAPTRLASTTRLKMNVTNGKDTLEGDMELFVCWDLDEDQKNKSRK